jgi:glycosyltransferase involved in cell wall biosynthesis
MHQLSRVLGLGDRVIWTGPVTVTASAYSAMDLCVSSSSGGEGIPESIAEAMACGTPVVATDVGDSAWLIGDERSIVPPEDPGALAERILHLLNDIEDDLVDGATLRARIDRELSLQRLLGRMEAVLLG